MKIVFIGLDVYSRSSGIGRYSQGLVRAFDELKGKFIDSCTVISLWDGAEAAAKAPQTVRYIPCKRNKVRAALEFIRQIFKQKPDVILYGHVVLAPIAIAGRLLRPSARHMLIVYGVDVWGNKYRPMPVWEPWLVRRFISHIVTCSRYTQTQMARVYSLDNSRFFLLPPPIDLPPGELKNAPGNASRLLTVSRLSLDDRYKGVNRVIYALPLILKRFPDVMYDVIGEGPLVSELKHLARQCDVAEHVHFWGYVTDSELQKAYSQSSIFVMPSTGEGFGIVFVEAWLHGLPVVCGNRDASSEVVTNGLNGITVDPESKEELAGAIILLLSEPEKARRMGVAGYQTALAKYSHEEYLENLSAILKRTSLREELPVF